MNSCYSQGIEYIIPKMIWSYVWFFTRNCGSEDHRRIRISVILFLCLGHGGWEDTLMHPHWHACALLSLEHFPLHIPISSDLILETIFSQNTSWLPPPGLAATSLCFPVYLSQHLMQSVELTNTFTGWSPHFTMRQKCYHIFHFSTRAQNTSYSKIDME